MSGEGEFESHSGLRAAINARLEDISFRTGVFIGSAALVVIAAVGGAIAVLGFGGQPASALGGHGTANPAKAAPSSAPSATAATRPSAAPARSAPASPHPARTAAASAPYTGSPSAGQGGGSQYQAAYGSRREGAGPGSPTGWRYGFPPGPGLRGWGWNPYRGGFHFGGRRG